MNKEQTTKVYANVYWDKEQDGIWLSDLHLSKSIAEMSKAPNDPTGLLYLQTIELSIPTYLL